MFYLNDLNPVIEGPMGCVELGVLGKKTFEKIFGYHGDQVTNTTDFEIQSHRNHVEK